MDDNQYKVHRVASERATKHAPTGLPFLMSWGDYFEVRPQSIAKLKKKNVSISIYCSEHLNYAEFQACHIRLHSPILFSWTDLTEINM